MESERFRNNLFTVLFLFAIALVVFVFFPYINAMILGLAFAILFHPIYNQLKKLMPKWEGLASLATVIISILIILAPLTFFGIRIFHESQGLYAQFASGEKDQLIDFLHKSLERIAPWINIDFSQYAKQLLNFFIANLGPIFSQITNITATFFFAFFTLYYIFKDGSRLRKAILKISPLPHEETEKILESLSNMASSVVKGSLFMAILHGVFVGIGFFIFGVQNPVLWGSVAIVVSLIPFVGIALVVLPGALALFLSGSIASAIGLMVFCFTASGIIDNFIKPRFIEKDIKAHPLLVLFSVLGGIAIFGPMGFILGPLALSLLLSLFDIYPVVIKRES